MALLRLFGFLALTLCLVCCICATSDSSSEDATSVTEDVQETVKKLQEEAEQLQRNAQNVLKAVEGFKTGAEKGAADAEAKVNGNPKFKEIADEAKVASDKVNQLHSAALAAAKKAVNDIKKLLTKCTQFLAKSNKQMLSDADSANKNTETDENAEDSNINVEELKTELKTAKEAFGVSSSKKKEIEVHAQKAQQGPYHIDTIISVGKIDEVMKSADDVMALIEEKKAEITTSVEEVKKLHDTAPRKLKSNIFSLYSSAKESLNSASRAAEEANQIKTFMLNYKIDADSSVEKFKAGVDLDKAKGMSGAANWYVAQLGNDVSRIKGKLNSMTAFASTADALLDDATNEMRKKHKIGTHGMDHHHGKDATESPARIANAMTVSVQLVLALIACAALH